MNKKLSILFQLFTNSLSQINQIAFVSNFDHYRMGGQKSMLALIEDLDRAKFNPIVFLPNKGDLSDYLDKINIKYRLIQTPPLKPKNILKIIKTYYKSKRIIKEENIHLIHSDFERDAILFGYASSKMNIPSIWHIRLTRATKSDKIILKYNQGIIGISDACKKRINHLLSPFNTYKTIYNGVDTELFNNYYNKNSLRKLLNLDQNKKYILFVGQLKDGKGILDLINAFNIIQDKNVKLLLIGKEENDEKLSEYKELINKFNLNEIISIQGQKQGIHKYMQAADLLILPSHEGNEGMGRVMFEAMSCGTPAMGSNISGVNEAIIDNSLMFSDKNPIQIAEKIIALFNNEKHYQKFKLLSRQVALNKFDIKSHAKYVMKLYDDLLNQN